MIEIFVQPALTRLTLETIQGLTGQDLITNKENFNDNDNNNNNLSIVYILPILFYLGISIYAVNLSWNCESNKVYSIVTRIVFAFFAWIFGIYYIVVNFMFFNCRRPMYL
jgi:hypothetical protein